MGDGLSLKSLHDLPGPTIAVIPHRRVGAAVTYAVAKHCPLWSRIRAACLSTDTNMKMVI